MTQPEIVEEMKKTQLELEQYEDLLYRKILNDVYGRKAKSQDQS